MRTIALISGASGGIGADIARVFARHGHDLALVARSGDKLEALADEIEATGRVRPIVIVCDLTASGAIDDVASALFDQGAQVEILVNNAGYGLLGSFDTMDAASQRGIIDLNITALIDLTHRFLPDIKALRGKILNVGSIASYMPGPGMAVYYASKAFVSAFSRALAEELKAEHVSVSVLQPGVTATNFHTRAGLASTGAAQRKRGASALSVAEAGYAGLMAGHRTIVPGLGNRLGAIVLPLVPDAILLPLIHRFPTVTPINRIKTGRENKAPNTDMARI